MKWFRDDSGQVLVLTLFSMAVLIGGLGLAADVGVLYHARRHMQTAADAAAMAGATEMFYNGSANVATKAYAAAKANGVDNTVTGNNVVVTISPTLPGTASACASCVEVQLSTPNPTVFIQTLSSLFFQTSNFSTVNVSAKAVGGAPGNSTFCIYLTDPTLSSELDMQGNATINAPNCGVYVNSNSTSATTKTGAPPRVNSPSLEVVGNDPSASGLDPGHTQTGVAPQSPPIPLDLPAIPSTGCSSTFATTDITVAGETAVSGSSTKNVICFTNAVTIEDGVTLPGAAGNGVLYVFENGVTLNGAATFGSGTYSSGTGTFTNTSGAVLDLAGGTINYGNSTPSIYAPTSGAYNGIAILIPTTNTTWSGKCPASKVSPCMEIQRGSSNSVFDGIVFAPDAYIELQDHGGGVAATGMIARGLFVKASTLNVSNYSTANPLTTPFKRITLVQ
jgi:Flp pilus assembly protein TadG